MTSVEMAEINTKLAVIITTGNFQKEEMAAIRDRIHGLANSIGGLMGVPDQIREMKDQHRDMRTKIEDVQSKIAVVNSLADRVGKLEPIVDGLEKNRDEARGAIWGSRLMGAIIGALAAALVFLGIYHPKG